MILGQEPVTRRRFAVGDRGSDGRFTPGATTDDTIQASVQEGDADVQATLPEGERDRVGRRLYTVSELRCADQSTGRSADQVQVDGTWYEVRRVDRVRSVIAHYKVAVLALREPG